MKSSILETRSLNFSDETVDDDNDDIILLDFRQELLLWFEYFWYTILLTAPFVIDDFANVAGEKVDVDEEVPLEDKQNGETFVSSVIDNFPRVRLWSITFAWLL